MKSFDGLHRRSMPKLYKALDPGVEDDRMKGALWTLNASAFGASARIAVLSVMGY